MNLYDLTKNQMTLTSMIEEYAFEHDGDITDIESIIDEWAKEYSTDEKISSICALVKEWTAVAEAREKAADELRAKANTGYDKADRLKKWLLLNMEVMGKSKVDAGIYHVSVRTAGRASLIIDKPIEEIPVKYIETKFSVRKADIEKAIKDGDAEALSLAHYAEKTKFVVIS